MKKVFATITLATVMIFGSMSSFAGIIISDKTEPAPAPCSQNSKDGIIIFGKSEGIIIFGIVIVAGDCSKEKEGIIISD